jgi:hypothetical protein
MDGQRANNNGSANGSYALYHSSISNCSSMTARPSASAAAPIISPTRTRTIPALSGVEMGQ